MMHTLKVSVMNRIEIRFHPRKLLFSVVGFRPQKTVKWSRIR